jgi:hypothetical protein
VLNIPSIEKYPSPNELYIELYVKDSDLVSEKYSLYSSRFSILYLFSYNSPVLSLYIENNARSFPSYQPCKESDHVGAVSEYVNSSSDSS